VTRLLSYLATAAMAGSLLAAVPAAEAAPPTKRFLDETSWSLNLRDEDNGYGFQFSGYVMGMTGKSDAVRIEMSQKGKALASLRCGLREANMPGVAEVTSCVSQDVQLTALGDVVAKLFYVDDQSESEELIRTFKLKVVAVDGSGETNFGYYGDDLLGAAYAMHESTGHSGNDRTLLFYFWMAGDIPGGNAQLRCTVDGKRLADFEGYVNGGNGRVQLEARKGEQWLRYKWERVEIRAHNMRWGKRAETDKLVSGDFVTVGDHPGAWSCDLRADGKVYRTFRFDVGADGTIAHQSDAAVLPSVAMIEVALPKTPVDTRVRPDAIRAGHSLGLAWSNDERTKAMLKALPPASGTPDAPTVKVKAKKK
jgi:hypothetical protein